MEDKTSNITIHKCPLFRNKMNLLSSSFYFHKTTVSVCFFPNGSQSPGRIQPSNLEAK